MITAIELDKKTAITILLWSNFVDKLLAEYSVSSHYYEAMGEM